MPEALEKDRKASGKEEEKRPEDVEIVETKGTVGGNPRIKGTRIEVADIVQYYLELDWTIEKISEELDLTPSEVLEALKYYYENPKKIRREIRFKSEESA